MGILNRVEKRSDNQPGRIKRRIVEAVALGERFISQRSTRFAVDLWSPRNYDKDKMLEAVKTITNDSQAPLQVWIEPWGDMLVLAPGKQFEIRARSDCEGVFETVRSDGSVIVYLWQGCTARVYDGQKLVRDLDNPVPELPPDTSVKNFLGIVLDPTVGRSTKQKGGIKVNSNDECT